MPADLRLSFDLTGELTDAMGANVRRVVQATAARIKADARRRILDPPKTGRVYKSRKKPSPHQASAAGESPANWTGELQEGLHYTSRALGDGGAEAEITVDAPYADILEFGSPGGKIAARPFLGPSVDAAAPQFVADMEALTREVAPVGEDAPDGE